jgi:hypothetical protein
MTKYLWIKRYSILAYCSVPIGKAKVKKKKKAKVGPKIPYM